MASLGLSASPGFFLLAAFLYYAGGWAAVTAFSTAALAHELGHLAAMLLVRADVRRVRVTAAGPVIEYGGAISARQELAVVAAGPLAGLLFAWGCLLSGSAYFRYAGCVSFLAAAFNLLPVIPMDGGRLAFALLCTEMPEEAAALLMRVMGTLCGLGVTLTGTELRSPAAAAAGIWMTVLANKPKMR